MVLLRHVGQVGNLRPIVNRPCAGPQKFLWRFDEPCLNGIHLDVTHNSLKLRMIADQSIIAFDLLKRPAGESEHPVSLPRCKPLERVRQLGDLHTRSDQHVHVVGHDDTRVEFVVFQGLFPITDRVHDHVRDLRPAQVQRSCASVVEHAVHGEEHMPGGRRLGKAAACGEAAVQAPREEDGLADRMKMWRAADAEGAHNRRVAAGRENSLKHYKADCQSAAGFQPALHGRR
jgi:hypothetical protein